MFRLLSTIMVFYFIFYTYVARGESDTIFNMDIQIVCDETQKILNFLEDEDYEVLVRGITSTGAGDILTIVYAREDSLVMIGVDEEGFSCFIGEVSNDLKWYQELDLPKYRGPKIKI